MKKRPARKPSRSLRKATKKPRRVLKRILRRVRPQRFIPLIPDHPIPPGAGTPHHDTPSMEEFPIPHRYGEDRMVLLVRDPWWLFSYWELTESREREGMRSLESAGLTKDRLVLRVYDVTGASLAEPNSFFDIEIGSYADNWYIDVGSPDREWVAEVGLRAHGGRFFALLTSNTVRTPAFGVSDLLDEEWMLPEHISKKIFGMSVGQRGGSSLEMRSLLQRYFKGLVSSEKSPALAAPAKAARQSP